MQTPPSIALGIFDLGASLSVPANSGSLSDKSEKTPFNQLLAARKLADLDGIDAAELTASGASELTELAPQLALNANNVESNSGNILLESGTGLPPVELGAQAIAAGVVDKATADAMAKNPLLAGAPGKYSVGAEASRGSVAIDSGQPLTRSEDKTFRAQAASNAAIARGEMASTRANSNSREALRGDITVAVNESGRANSAAAATDDGRGGRLPEQASSVAVLATGKAAMPSQGETLKSILQANIRHGRDNLDSATVVTNKANVGDSVAPMTLSAGVASSPSISDMSKTFVPLATDVDSNFDVENDGEAIAMSRLGDGSRASNPTSIPTLRVAENALTDNKWAPAFGARIAWMVSSGVHHANIELHPAELGGISVQISMQGDNAKVQFQTQTAETQDLIEKLMPRLTAGLEGQGLRLDEAKVSHASSWQETAGGATKFADAQNSSGRGNSGDPSPEDGSSSSRAAAATDTVDDRSQLLHSPIEWGTSSVDYYA